MMAISIGPNAAAALLGGIGIPGTASALWHPSLHVFVAAVAIAWPMVGLAILLTIVRRAARKQLAAKDEATQRLRSRIESREAA